jgi:hypothetical protein
MARPDTISAAIPVTLQRDLAEVVDGEVRFDAGTRAATAGALDHERPETKAAPRPAEPRPAAKAATLAGAAAGAAAAATAVWALTRRGSRR